jgi:hypothetical protein
MATIPDKVNTGALATIVVVGAISMVGISAALTAMVRAEVDTLADQVGAKSNLGPVRELKRTQLAELAEPARRDPTTGRAIIPIDRAKDLVVEGIREHPERATDPPPPDAGKKDDRTADAGADPNAAEAAATDPDAGTAPTEGTPAEGQPAEAPPAEGSQPLPAPALEDQGTAPAKPETGNGKKKSKGAHHAQAAPAVAPVDPEVPPAPEP